MKEPDKTPEGTPGKSPDKAPHKPPQPKPAVPSAGSGNRLDDLDMPRRYPLEEPEWNPQASEERSRGGSLLFLLLGALFIVGAFYGRKYFQKPPDKTPGAHSSQPGAPGDEGAGTDSDPDEEEAPPEEPAAPVEPEAPLALQSASPADEKALAAAGIKGTWRVVGQVFDLENLKPVADAQLVFRDPGGKSFKAATRASGKFKATLPTNVDGYTLSIRAARYKSVYMEDWIPSVTMLPREKRDELGADIGGKPQEEEHLFAKSGEEVEKNYVLIRVVEKKPSKKKGRQLR